MFRNLFAMMAVVLLSGCGVRDEPCHYSLSEILYEAFGAANKATLGNGLASQATEGIVNLATEKSEFQQCLELRCQFNDSEKCKDGEEACKQKQAQCLSHQTSLSQWNSFASAFGLSFPRFLMVTLIIIIMGWRMIVAEKWGTLPAWRKGSWFAWLYLATWLITLPLLVSNWLIIPYALLVGYWGWETRKKLVSANPTQVESESEPATERETEPEQPSPCLQCGGDCEVTCDTTGKPRDEPLATDESELKLI